LGLIGTHVFLDQRLKARLHTPVNRGNSLGWHANQLDKVLLRRVRDGHDRIGAARRTVYLTVVMLALGREQAGKAQEGQIVDGDYRRTRAEERGDEVGAMKHIHGVESKFEGQCPLLPPVMTGRYQGDLSKPIRGIGMATPKRVVFATQEDHEIGIDVMAIRDRFDEEPCGTTYPTGTVIDASSVDSETHITESGPLEH
jgi:hypothetical protein